MGSARSKIPPISETDMRTVMGYLLEESHIMKLWHKFVEVDADCNGVWTISEVYDLVQEPRASIRAPIIDSLFFMADGNNDGTVSFQDFLVTFCSFCALSREEVTQLFFIVVDKDRNGRLEKDELLDFFAFTGDAGGGERGAPVFPINCANALEKFRGGAWTSLEFDGLALLCERFPYISYPIQHTQELFRTQLLGQAFWERLDNDRRDKFGATRVRRVRMPGKTEKVEVKMPGRCTMQELLEYSKRKTSVEAGKRVASQETGPEINSSITRDKDEQISRCPLLSMIRNPRCMYYIPRPEQKAATLKRAGTRAEMELPDFFDGDSSRPGTSQMPTGIVIANNAIAAETIANWDDGGVLDSSDESGSDDSD